MHKDLLEHYEMFKTVIDSLSEGNGDPEVDGIELANNFKANLTNTTNNAVMLGEFKEMVVAFAKCVKYVNTSTSIQEEAVELGKKYDKHYKIFSGYTYKYSSKVY